MKEERFPHTRKPFRGRRQGVGRGGSFRAAGAEAQASEVRSQGEDWGWRCEHSLKGASAPQLAGRDSGKKSGPA